MSQSGRPVAAVCDCVAKWLNHLTVNRKITGSSPTSYYRREKKTSFFLHLAPNPGPSKIVNRGPSLGWGRTRPLVVPNSSEVHVGLRVPTPQCRGIVSAPASAWPGSRSLSLALGPVFPEVVHRGPSLIWSGGAYPVRELLTFFVFFVLCSCCCSFSSNVKATEGKVERIAPDLSSMGLMCFWKDLQVRK